MLIALGFFIPIFIDYINTGLVAKFPTLIVCGFVALSSIVAFFNGMQLATMVQKNKQDFEMRLIEIHDGYVNKKRENSK